ncbi:hypothetical protein IEQ34_011775 [Dendrobium chrysotoxum]|uniref:Hexosyltransferase n=1 Tax=Dendrobium chrysotoxum TaxID=161865 RepID=A0AAV7GSH2_DENCH|nr:hypothetical protein IEQ34_011775 [Dendrobium chrysotoxum]
MQISPPICPSKKLLLRLRYSYITIRGGGRGGLGGHVPPPPPPPPISSSQSIYFISSSQSIYFQFLASKAIPYLNSTISTTFAFLHFLIHPFDPSLVSDLFSTSIRTALDHPLNYARSYLPRLLPSCISPVVYLNSDLILVDDIAAISVGVRQKNC